VRGEPLIFRLAPYDRNDDGPHGHVAFVFRNWRRSGEGREVLHRWLRSPDTRCVVITAPEPKDRVFYGYVVVNAGRLIWAYTREPLQKEGYMTMTLLRLGFDPAGPSIPCLYWSRVFTEIAARGYHFVYDPEGKLHAEKSTEARTA